MLPPNLLLQNRYQIIRKIAQGGMGAVYEAVDQRLGHTVALKQIVRGDAVIFAQEAQLLARLRHPALPKVSDHFVDEAGQFLVMDFIPGDDLATLWLRRKAELTQDTVLTWGDQLLATLDYLHTQTPPVIHRDIKPANLKLTAEGQLVLLDFGLAKGKTGETDEAQKSVVGYTLAYAAPEQVRSAGTDARSDLYSAAATLYHLLVGATPPDAIQRAQALTEQRPDPLGAWQPPSSAVPTELLAVLHKAMALNPAERFADAATFRTALRLATQLPVQIPNNLPTQLTTLVGRMEAITTLQQRLAQDGVRLITLTGVGGSGKTRLALAVAQNAVDSTLAPPSPPNANPFTDGVFFINLAAIRDADLVLTAIAQTLGVKEAATPLREALQNYLRDKRLLLVLDNFEQVIDAATLLSELLLVSPLVKMLVTSRETLRLRGEHEFVVPTLTPDAAVALFNQRAQAIKPGFTADAETVIVTAICRQLDYLPLAIELAAARVKVLTLPAMLERLSSAFGARLALLRGGARDLPQRQQTMQAAIDWSYHLLTPEEQTLFQQLAIFRGGWTLDAVAEVCQLPTNTALIPEPDEVITTMASLLDKSLIQPAPVQQAEPRYTMLATLHEYAAAQLADNPAFSPVAARHTAYYLQVAEMAEVHLATTEQGQWFDRLEAEHDNLRAALQRTLSKQATTESLRFCAALWQFWHRRSYLQEGQRWLEAALTLAVQLPPPPTLLVALANVYRAAGGMAYLQGDYAHTINHYQQALQIYRRLDNQGGISSLLGNLGMIAHYQGDYASAARYHEEALQIDRASGDQWQIAASYSNLGALAKDQGHFAQAQAYWGESLAIFRTLGDLYYVTGHTLNLGELAYLQGDYPHAIALCTQSLEMARNQEDTMGVMLALHNLGLIAVAQGRFDHAATHLHAALQMCETLGDRWNRASTQRALGQIAYYQGDYTQAEQLCQESLTANRALDYKQAVAGALWDLGRIALRQGQPAQATALQQESLTLYQMMNDQSGIIACLKALATVTLAQQQVEQAQRLFHAAETLRQHNGLPMAPVEAREEKPFVAALAAAVRATGIDGIGHGEKEAAIETVIREALAYHPHL